MNRHSRSTNHRWLPTRLGGAALTAAAILGTTALVVARRARQAERNNPPTGRFLDIEGVHLHYLERGEGPPLVLLHGNGAMVQDFEISGILERLAQRYRVIAVDRPGFGHTNRPRSQSWTPAAQAELVHKALVQLEIKDAIVVGHSWGTLVALSLALDHPADVRRLVLLSGYYFPSLRADVLASLPSAAPVIGDLLSYTVAPLLGRAMRSRVFRKLFAPAAVPPRFQAEFPTELSLRPSQLKASAIDTVSMTPSAAALAARYGELKMPILIMAGTGDRLVDFASQSGRLDEVLAQSTLVPFEGAGHMIHHSAPEKVVDGINLAASRPGIAENSQSMQQPITVDAGHCNRLRNHEVKDASV
jgi:pimeloyl-ACP methyl ester carboxylesterase